MDAIDQALSQVRTEIGRIRQYLAQLEEAERELATLRETRQVIAQQWYVPPATPASNGMLPRVVPVSPAKVSDSRRKRRVGQSLATDVLQLLKSTGRPMPPIEIDAELRKRGGEMHTNAVTSVLSRLLKNHLVSKDKDSKYSLETSSDRGEDNITVRPTSLAGQAYTILKKAGTPLTGEEIAARLQREGREVNPRSVITSVYHCAQDGQLFKLLGAKTFGLLEWGESVIPPIMAQPFLEKDAHQTGDDELKRAAESLTENKNEQGYERLSHATDNNNVLDGMLEV